MNIFSLDKKLVKIKHRITKEEYVGMDIPQESFEAGIVTEMIKQTADYVMKQLPTTITRPTEEEPSFTFEAKGYIMTEKDMINAIKEVAEMDGVGREMIIKSCNRFLGI